MACYVACIVIEQHIFTPSRSDVYGPVRAYHVVEYIGIDSCAVDNDSCADIAGTGRQQIAFSITGNTRDIGKESEFRSVARGILCESHSHQKGADYASVRNEKSQLDVFREIGFISPCLIAGDDPEIFHTVPDPAFEELFQTLS